MKITKTSEGGSLTVSLEGRLDSLTAPELERELQSVPESTERLVFDFSALSYISSAGLRVLVTTEQAMEKQGGSVKVLNPCREVQTVFEITGLMEMLGVEHTDGGI